MVEHTDFINVGFEKVFKSSVEIIEKDNISFNNHLSQTRLLGTKLPQIESRANRLIIFGLGL